MILSTEVFEPFDHKHQDVSIEDQAKGLNRMGIDIVTTLMNAFIIEEGLEISDTFFRDLGITYQAVAEEQIKKHSDDASFSNLKHDRDAEEHLVKNVFHQSILQAGEVLTAPFRPRYPILTDTLCSCLSFRRGIP